MSDKKQKRVNLSNEKKLEVIKKLQSGVSHQAIMKEYGISSSQCYQLPNNVTKILEVIKDNSIFKTRKNMRACKNADLDSAVFMWFQQMRSRGEPVNGPALQEKALIFNEKLNNSTTFKASSGWLNRFKKRYGISFES
ncbi:tigger transposable element-derived protein 4-like [Leptopilina heterotoma]|uniref:tigger transposable element-derived protein 4-like n=1 Tax=Leptopilina heterotoma TaxID=63436 RepID=UPI001CA9D314|nr:tigger transposable element-derived protein 4-like [Leptopilina heterotoma]